MNVNKFRIDGGSVAVEYTEGSDLFKIETGDEPRAELLAAAVATVALAQAALATEFDATFREITISHGSEPGSRITLTMPCYSDSVRIGLPRISSHPVRDGEGELIPGHPRNQYNEQAERFVEEIKGFIQGKRQQLALDFEPEAQHVG
jgi:hypothetical protein